MVLRIQARRLAGTGRNCPCCGGEFRSFATFTIEGWRFEDSMCPGCGSLQRQRVLWLYIRDCTDMLSRPRHLLHFAPEWSLYRALSRVRGLDYVTADLHPSSLARRRIDITRIPFPDDSFDWLLCSHVLEHVPDDRAAMAEIRRVLKPDGVALLQHPIDPNRAHTYEDPSITDPVERRRAFGQSDHVRVYGTDFARRLADAGLDVTEIRYRESLPDEVVERCRLDDPSTMRSQDIMRCTPTGARRAERGRNPAGPLG